MEILIEKVFLEKGKLDFLAIYEEKDGDRLEKGMKKKIHDSPERLEQGGRSFVWRKERDGWGKELLDMFLTFYL